MKVPAIFWVGAALLIGPTSALPAPGTNDHPSKPVPQTSDVRRVQVEEFEKLWKEKRNIVLDVRTAKEFNASHIPGATNLDVNLPDFDQKLSALDKDKVYLVHCAAGVRSARACERMSRHGFRHLIDLAPGFKGWERAGKKIEK
jgi:rhodanese-related sulfurtransferase